MGNNITILYRHANVSTEGYTKIIIRDEKVRDTLKKALLNNNIRYVQTIMTEQILIPFEFNTFESTLRAFISEHNVFPDADQIFIMED